MTDADEQIYHIRVSGTPELEHTQICEFLNIKAPLRRNHQLLGKRLKNGENELVPKRDNVVAFWDKFAKIEKPVLQH